VASHWGGTRNGAIVSWPNGIHAKAEIRSQFHHVIDVARPYSKRRAAEPVVVNSVQQKPLEGVSMLYSLTMPRRRSATRPSTSRCSSTAASITRVGGRHPAQHPWPTPATSLCRL